MPHVSLRVIFNAIIATNSNIVKNKIDTLGVFLRKKIPPERRDDYYLGSFGVSQLSRKVIAWARAMFSRSFESWVYRFIVIRMSAWPR